MRPRSCSARCRKELSGIIQRALRRAATKQLASAARKKIRKVWKSAPGGAIERAEVWWDLFAHTGATDRTTHELWSDLFERLEGMLTFSSIKLAWGAAGHVRLISGVE